MKIFYILLLLAAGSFVFSLYIKEPGINGPYTEMYPDMVYGRAYKPFVTRAFLPICVRLSTYAIPVTARNALSAFVEKNESAKTLFDKLGWEAQFATEYFIGVFYLYVFLLLFLFALRRLTADLYSVNEHVPWLTAILGAFALPVFFHYYSHIYDLPNLFFFTIGMIFLVKAKWEYYLPAFALSCFNKETTILLTVLFFICYYQSEALPELTFKYILLGQIVAFAISRMVLQTVFATNSSALMEPHNLGLLHPYSLQILGTLALFGLLSFYDWKAKHRFLKRAGLLIFPVALASTFRGRLDEFKFLYEIFPIAALLALHTILKITRTEFKLNDCPAIKNALKFLPGI